MAEEIQISRIEISISKDVLGTHDSGIIYDIQNFVTNSVRIHLQDLQWGCVGLIEILVVIRTYATHMESLPLLFASYV